MNPYNVMAADVQIMAEELSNEIRDNSIIEVPFVTFDQYLYDYYKLEFSKSMHELERIFTYASFKQEKTKNINEFLQYLHGFGIRTGVISNISLSGKMLREVIEAHIPNHHFEFIVASSDYIFRKPHSWIYKIALRKAELSAGEVWYCGDNAVCDVDGARACGIFPVWYKGALQNEHIPQNKCLEIYDWNELIEVIEELE